MYYEGNMKKAHALIILMLISFSATAETTEWDKLFSSPPWDKEEKILQGATFLVTAIDWKQTLDIRTHPGQKETSFILGQHPTNRRINQQFIIGLAAHTWLMDKLNHKWRKRLQWFSFTWEANNAYTNMRVDIIWDH